MGAREVLLARHRTLIGVFTGSCRAGWGWCLTRTSDKAFIRKIRIFCGWLLCVYYALFLAIHDLLTFWFGIRIWNAIGFLLGVILNNFLNSEINSKLSYNKFRFFSVGLNLMYKLNIWYFSKCWCVYIFINYVHKLLDNFLSLQFQCRISKIFFLHESTCNIKQTPLFSCFMPSGGEMYRNGNITYTRQYSSKLKNSITNSQIKFTWK